MDPAKPSPAQEDHETTAREVSTSVNSSGPAPSEIESSATTDYDYDARRFWTSYANGMSLPSDRFVVHDFIQQEIKKRNSDLKLFTRILTRKFVPPADERVWRCWHELRRLISSIRHDDDTLPVIIIKTHGYMRGKDHWLVSNNDRCKMCRENIRLNDVIYLLDSLFQDVFLIPIACRTQQEGQDSTFNSVFSVPNLPYYSDYSNMPILATPHVALLQPCGPGDIHTSIELFLNPTIKLIFTKLREFATPRAALVDLHGQYIYHDQGYQINNSPIEVQVDDQWMQGSVVRITPKDELIRLYDIYKSKESEEKRCAALSSLRHHLYVCFDAIDTEILDQFCDDLLSAVKEETNEKVRGHIIKVITEMDRNKTDPKSGKKRWKELNHFIKSSFDGGNCRLKEIVLSIIYESNLSIGINSKWTSAVESCLLDADEGVVSAATKIHVLRLFYEEDRSFKKFNDLIVVPTVIEILVGDHNLRDKEVSIRYGVDYLYCKLFEDWKYAIDTFGQNKVEEWLEQLAATGDVCEKLAKKIATVGKHSEMIAPLFSLCTVSNSVALKKMTLQIIRKCPWLIVKKSACDVLILFEGFMKIDSLLLESIKAFGAVLKIVLIMHKEYAILVPLFLKSCARYDSMILPTFAAVDESDLEERQGDSLFYDTISCTISHDELELTNLLEISVQFLLDVDPTSILTGLMGVSTVWRCKDWGQMEMEMGSEEIIDMIVPFLNNPHTESRIVHSTCRILIRMAAYFKKTHEKVVPALISILDKAEGCLAASAAFAIAAISKHIEDFGSVYVDSLLPAIDGRFPSLYRIPLDKKKQNILIQFLVVLYALFKTTPDRSKEKYEVFINPLMNIVKTTKNECLRGKSFECINMMISAVRDGKAVEYASDLMTFVVAPLRGRSIFSGRMYDNFLEDMKRLTSLLGVKLAEFLPDLTADLRGVIEDCYENTRLWDEVLEVFLHRTRDIAISIDDEHKNKKKEENEHKKGVAIELFKHIARLEGETFASYVIDLNRLMFWYIELFIDLYPSVLDIVKYSGGITAKRDIWSTFWTKMKGLLDKELSETHDYIRIITDYIEQIGHETISVSEQEEIGTKIGNLLKEIEELGKCRKKSKKIYGESMQRIVELVNAGLKVLGAHFHSSLRPMLPLLFSLLDASEKWKDNDLRDSLIKNLTDHAPQLGISSFKTTAMADKSAFVPLHSVDQIDDYAPTDDAIFGQMPEAVVVLD